MTPALRIRNDPATKTARRWSGGNPSEARTSAHSVGSSKRYVPLWLCKRISRASADQGIPDGVEDAGHEPVVMSQTLAAEREACQFP